MADLVERQLGLGPRRKIPNHALAAVMAEWARGKLTAAQALDALEIRGAERLVATEQAEAQAIVNLVTGIAVSGSAAAVADGKASRALKIAEVTHVFDALDHGCAGYRTAAEVRAKLGIAG